MDKILVVSSSEQGSNLLAQLLEQQGFLQPHIVQTGQQARFCLETSSFDLVIINTPLTDEFGHDLLKLTARYPLCNVIMLIKQQQIDAVGGQVAGQPVLFIAKPLKRCILQQSLTFIRQKQELIFRQQQECHRMEAKIQEINILNRAKLVLVQVLNMTEAQAHRYIEKQAMDMRITKREVAEGVLKTYEN